MWRFWPAGHSSAWRAIRISTISAVTMNSTPAPFTVRRLHILAEPHNEWTLADRYATDEMFDRFPAGLECRGIPREAGAGRIGCLRMARWLIWATGLSR